MLGLTVGHMWAGAPQPPTLGGPSFNTLTSLTNTSTSVATSTTQVRAANSGRQYLLLVNDSTSKFYCNLSNATATIGAGIPLFASGGYYEITPDNLYTGAIQCIATSTAGILTIVEK